jgi:hypothetical protein
MVVVNDGANLPGSMSRGRWAFMAQSHRAINQSQNTCGARHANILALLALLPQTAGVVLRCRGRFICRAATDDLDKTLRAA